MKDIPKIPTAKPATNISHLTYSKILLENCSLFSKVVHSHTHTLHPRPRPCLSMKILAIIQVRSSSERFPEKALAKIAGKTILQHIISRLKKIEDPRFLYVFAVSNKNTGSIINELKNEKFHFGSEKNVLERFYSTLRSYKREDVAYVIRLTADNPFFDYSEINRLMAHFEAFSLQDFDYVYMRGLPLGMGFEWISTTALLKQKKFPLQVYHKEHVTIFIRENPKIFRVQSIPIRFPLLAQEREHSKTLFYDFRELKVRLTLDERADLQMLEKTYHYFNNKGKPFFTAKDVLNLYFENPGFYQDNLHVRQRFILKK